MPVSSRSDKKLYTSIDQVPTFSGNFNGVKSELWGSDHFVPYIFDYYNIGNLNSIIISIKVVYSSWSYLLEYIAHDSNHDTFFLKKFFLGNSYNYVLGVIPLSTLTLFLFISVIVYFIVAVLLSILIVPFTFLQALARTPERFITYVDIFYCDCMYLEFFTDLEANIQAKRNASNKNSPYNIIQMPLVSKVYSICKNNLAFHKVFYFEFYKPFWIPFKKLFHISWHILALIVYIRFLLKLTHVKKNAFIYNDWFLWIYWFLLNILIYFIFLPLRKVAYTPRWFEIAWNIFEWFFKVTAIFLCLMFVLPYF